MAHSEPMLCSSVRGATFGLQSICNTHFTSAGDEKIRALYGSELKRPQSGGETITQRSEEHAEATAVVSEEVKPSKASLRAQ